MTGVRERLEKELNQIKGFTQPTFVRRRVLLHLAIQRQRLLDECGPLPDLEHYNFACLWYLDMCLLHKGDEST